jgi:hypothetical protein
VMLFQAIFGCSAVHGQMSRTVAPKQKIRQRRLTPMQKIRERLADCAGWLAGWLAGRAEASSLQRLQIRERSKAEDSRAQVHSKAEDSRANAESKAEDSRGTLTPKQKIRGKLTVEGPMRQIKQKIRGKASALEACAPETRALR